MRKSLSWPQTPDTVEHKHGRGFPPLFTTEKMKNYIPSALIFLTLFATPPTATAQGIEWETLRTEMSTLFKKGEIDRAVLVGMQTIEIAEKASGAEHPSVALSLSSVGVIHNLSGKYAKALPLFNRALAIREKAFPADDEQDRKSVV